VVVGESRVCGKAINREKFMIRMELPHRKTAANHVSGDRRVHSRKKYLGIDIRGEKHSIRRLQSPFSWRKRLETTWNGCLEKPQKELVTINAERIARGVKVTSYYPESRGKDKREEGETLATLLKPNGKESEWQNFLIGSGGIQTRKLGKPKCVKRKERPTAAFEGEMLREKSDQGNGIIFCDIE